MSSTAIKSLIVLLVIQAVLTATMFARDNSLTAFTPHEPLLDLQLDQLSKIIVTEGKDSLTLEQHDGTWVLPHFDHFPISDSKRALFEDKLFTINKPYPVGNTEIAAKQFETSEEKFKKRLAFYKGETLVENLFLGNSPGFKKIHVRKGSEEQTFSIEFSSYDLQTTATAWYDRNFLKVKQDDLSKLELKDITVAFENGVPLLDGLTDSEEPVADKLDDLVKQTTRLTFSDMLGTEEKKSYRMESPILTFTLTQSDGSTVEYLFGAPEPEQKKDGEEEKAAPAYHAVLKLSTAPFYFRISDSKIQDLLAWKRSDLVKAKEVEEKATEEGATEATSSQEPHENATE